MLMSEVLLWLIREPSRSSFCGISGVIWSLEEMLLLSSLVISASMFILHHKLYLLLVDTGKISDC